MGRLSIVLSESADSIMFQEMVFQQENRQYYRISSIIQIRLKMDAIVKIQTERRI